MFFSSILSEDYSRGARGALEKPRESSIFIVPFSRTFLVLFVDAHSCKKRKEKCHFPSFNNTEETPEIYMTGWKRPWDFVNFDVFHHLCARDSRHSALYHSCPQNPAATALFF